VCISTRICDNITQESIHPQQITSFLRATMLTQPLPYNAASATYEPITPAKIPTLPTPPTPSSRKFSFHSVKSHVSTSTTSTARSTLSKKSLRLKSRLHSLLKPSSKNSGTGIEDMSGDGVGSVTARKASAQKAPKANRVERNPDADKMFTWAALGVYAYPGAGPLVAWF
jgi:hypothetical protein